MIRVTKLAVTVWDDKAVLGLNGKKALDVADSGAAIDVVINSSYAVPGSVRPNFTVVQTANGDTTPPFMCDRLAYHRHRRSLMNL